jgi:hypothetical protein
MGARGFFWVVGVRACGVLCLLGYLGTGIMRARELCVRCWTTTTTTTAT